MRYFIKNLDGTMYNSNVALVDGGPSVDSALGEKIFIYYWANESYGFFCKKPQKGKPLQILVGDEWKLLNHTQSVRVDSTVKFFQRYMYSPKIEKGQESRLVNVYLIPREDPSQQFEIRQDSSEIKHFFIREIRGEWMKLPAMYRLQLLLYPLCRRDRVRELGRNIPAQLNLSDLLDPMEAGDEATHATLGLLRQVRLLVG